MQALFLFFKKIILGSFRETYLSGKHYWKLNMKLCPGETYTSFSGKAQEYPDKGIQRCFLPGEAGSMWGKPLQDQ